MYDMHINNIRIHSYLAVDINKANTKYVYQAETSGDSDRQICTARLFGIMCQIKPKWRNQKDVKKIPFK